jgi:uroporphyrinogen III methyltransferase/synthase
MKALEGKRVLVTRSRDQADELCQALAVEGAEPVRFPVIAVRPGPDLAPLDRAIEGLEEYDWLGLTSANAVRVFWDRLLRHRPRLPVTLKVAAVGPATARALEALGVRVDFIPAEYRGERLADGMGEVRSRRILLPRASGARESLPDALAAAGAVVDDIPVYSTVQATPGPEAFGQLRRGVDAVTFTSASTVRCFAAVVRAEGEDVVAMLRRMTIACLGPVVADAARAIGLCVDVQPAEYTVAALVQALGQYYRLALSTEQASHG